MGTARQWERVHGGERTGEEGFTLVELLVVVAIVAALIAIAVPSYLGYKGRAADHAAKANIRAALPVAEAYYNDNGTYAGMTIAVLKTSYDSGLAPSLAIYGTPSATYCLTDTQDGHAWSVRGPGFNSSNFVANATCS